MPPPRQTYDDLLVALARADPTRTSPHPPAQVVARAAAIDAGTAEPYPREAGVVPPPAGPPHVPPPPPDDGNPPPDDGNPPPDDGNPPPDDGNPPPDGGNPPPPAGDAGAAGQECFPAIALPEVDVALQRIRDLITTAAGGNAGRKRARQRLLAAYLLLVTDSQFSRMAYHRRDDASIMWKLALFLQNPAVNAMPAPAFAGHANQQTRDMLQLAADFTIAGSFSTSTSWANIAVPQDIPQRRPLTSDQYERALNALRYEPRHFDTRMENINTSLIIAVTRTTDIPNLFPVLRTATGYYAATKTSYNNCDFVAFRLGGHNPRVRDLPQEIPGFGHPFRLRGFITQQDGIGWRRPDGNGWMIVEDRPALPVNHQQDVGDVVVRVAIYVSEAPAPRARINYLTEEGTDVTTGPYSGELLVNLPKEEQFVAFRMDGVAQRTYIIDQIITMRFDGTIPIYGSTASFLFARYDDTLFTDQMRLMTLRETENAWRNLGTAVDFQPGDPGSETGDREHELPDLVPDDSAGPPPAAGAQHDVLPPPGRPVPPAYVLSSGQYTIQRARCDLTKLRMEADTNATFNFALALLVFPRLGVVRRMLLERDLSVGPPPAHRHKLRVQHQLRRAEAAIHRPAGDDTWLSSDDFRDVLVEANVIGADARSVAEVIHAVFRVIPVQLGIRRVVSLVHRAPRVTDATQLQQQQQQHRDIESELLTSPVVPLVANRSGPPRLLLTEGNFINRQDVRDRLQPGGDLQDLERIEYYRFATSMLVIEVRRNANAPGVLVRPMPTLQTGAINMALVGIMVEPPNAARYAYVQCTVENGGDNNMYRYSPEDDAEAAPIVQWALDANVPRYTTLLVYGSVYRQQTPSAREWCPTGDNNTVYAMRNSGENLRCGDQPFDFDEDLLENANVVYYGPGDYQRQRRPFASFQQARGT